MRRDWAVVCRSGAHVTSKRSRRAGAALCTSGPCSGCMIWFPPLLSGVICFITLMIVPILSRPPSVHRTLFTLFQFQDCVSIKDLYISDSQKVTNLVGLKSSPPNRSQPRRQQFFFMQKAAAVGESKEYTLTKSCNVWTNSCQAKHTTNML